MKTTSNVTVNWHRITATEPPQGSTATTRINDDGGPRNEQPLRRHRNLWFFPDMLMYVYYTPNEYDPATVVKDSPHAPD